MVKYLFLIPLLPLLAAGMAALARRPQRRLAATLAIGAMGASLALALLAFARTLAQPGSGREVFDFAWMQIGQHSLRLGWALDPLTAAMAVMVTFVGLLIFIYSVGYMKADENFTRFFCFLALFGAAMLGLVIANNLLLLFICWELVGLASYLLIGFWHQKPSAAAAAKKAFVTTRIGDLGFLLGMLWLYHETGTLLLYDNGQGCLESSAIGRLAGLTTLGGMAVSTAIALLIFCGAIGKSGQFPLHVWLPDAMEGPTPVSALIHAATMVAAGVFLVARVYPLFAALPPGASGVSTALQVVAWTGAFTALFAALIAVAQTDIKRILAYSTVSQLGFMMIGLGTGGVAAGMFHLITHAFFKALLFLGAGSVIHGCHEQQDIRFMGGLRRFMPVTFATYAVGMLALSGFPLLFSGFWSKDEILHAARQWPASQGPFYLGLAGALLTAFYMTRQVCHVFFGAYRGHGAGEHSGHAPAPHESPAVMTVPLMLLAAGAVLLGILGTPAWPWFHDYLTGHAAHFDPGRLLAGGALGTMIASSALALGGITAGWLLYGKRPLARADEPDVIEKRQPALFRLLQGKFFVDEFYAATVARFNAAAAGACDVLDRFLWGGLVKITGWLVIAISWLARLADEYLVNKGFDAGCAEIRESGTTLASWQSGRVQSWLRAIGLGIVLLVIYLAWT